MGISHKCNTRDPLINQRCYAITEGTPFPKGMGCGKLLGARSITPGPSQVFPFERVIILH